MADEDLPPDEGDAGVIDTPVEEQQEEQAPPSVDDLATDMGWTPQDKWRGDPEKWKPAHEYLRHTVDINKSQKSKLDSIEQQLGNMARTSAQITQQAVEKERERLSREQQEAFEVGDATAFNRAQQQIAQLPNVQQIDASGDVSAFTERNTWFGKDEEATRWAQQRTDQLAQQGIGHKRQLDIVEREAKQFFPDLFPDPAKAPPLNKPGARGGTAARQGFSSLPADARAAALDYEKRGVCTREEYAKTYYEEA